MRPRLLFYHGRDYGIIRSEAAFLLKQRGHDLIDEIHRLGVDRTQIYVKLGRRMGSPFRSHFSQVHDVGSLNSMVKHLEEMLYLARRPKGWKGCTPYYNKPKIDYKKMFTDKAVLRAVGERNRRRTLPTWRQWLLRAGDILFP